MTLSSIIDCDADPYCPKTKTHSGKRWRVVEHRKGGQLEWSSDKIELYLMGGPKKGVINGHKLLKNLEDKPVLNANVLDYLMVPEKQHLFPEDWKGRSVYFWGTIYREPFGTLAVRFCHFSVILANKRDCDEWARKWGQAYYSLDSDFNDSDFAVLLRS